MSHFHQRTKLSNPYSELEGYNCFGCSPFNRFGLQLEFYEEGEFLIAEWEPKSHFSGYKTILHGGIQATLLDEIASWAVQIKLKTAGVTARMDLRFKKPVLVDQGKIRLSARVDHVEKRIAFIETDLRNVAGEICCTGIVTYFVYPEEVAREKLNYPDYGKFFGPV